MRKFLLCVMMFCFPAYGEEIISDVQMWNSTRASFQAFRDFKLKAENDIRYSLRKRSVVYHHIDFGIEYNVLNIDAIYVGGYFRKLRENGILEYRPHLDVAYKGSIGLFSFVNRFRIEARMFEKELRWRIRDRVGVAVDFGDSVKLYGEDELFFAPSEVKRNRLKSGLFFKIENFFIDNYVMLQTDIQDMRHIGVLGLHMGIKL